MWNSKYSIRTVLLVAASVLVPVMAASADPAGTDAASPPLTMARFYIVDGDGRSASDKSVPIQVRQQNQRSVEPRRTRSDRRQRQRMTKAREDSGSRDLVNSTSSKATAWQCERHGFYFTADGRCIRPVIYMKQVPTQSIDRRPIRNTLRSR